MFAPPQEWGDEMTHKLTASSVPSSGQAQTESAGHGGVPASFVSSNDVMEELRAGDVLGMELRYGNEDLIRALDVANIAGPFSVVSPWELQDTRGVTRVHAAGYSALPFGERYPPLIEFVQRFLEVDRNMGLPQQSTTAWRAALEYNLIQLLAEVAPSHADSQVFFSNSGAEAIEGAIKFVKAFRPAAPYILNFTGATTARPMGR